MFCVISLVCLRALLCVHNVTSVSVLSICDYPLGFLYRIFTAVSYLQCFRIGKHGLIHKVHSGKFCNLIWNYFEVVFILTNYNIKTV